jgi:hypothetical protein
MADISTTHLDAGTDSPALARAALLEVVQRVNDYADEFTTPFLAAGNAARNQNNAAGDPAHIWEVTNDNTAYQVLRVNSYGAGAYGNNVHWCRYHGTVAAPSAIGSGAYMMSMGFRGWDGSGVLSQSAAAFQCLTREAWTPSAHGCAFVFATSNVGGATRRTVLQIASNSSDGGVLKVGDGATGYAQIQANGITAALDLHGSDDLTGARLLLIGSAYGASPGEAWLRGAKVSFQNIAGTEFGAFDAAGNLQVGMSGGSARVNVQGAGSQLVAQWRNNAGTGMFYGGASNLSPVAGENAASAMLYVRKDNSTNRSINAAGTINASGADYAERMQRAPGCCEIQPGQVVGIDERGRLTDRWADARHFMVASTNPSFVGNDVFDDDQPLVAFAGQVPCNVLGAVPGDYIVPVQAGAGIAGAAVGLPDLMQYMRAVGRVIAIEENGQPRVVVKAA